MHNAGFQIIPPITDSDLNKLLHQIYGFRRNQHRWNRVSWTWIHDDIPLVDYVVGWNTFPSNPGTPDQIAKDLGLDSQGLQLAVNGEYSRTTLRLVLYIYQVHRDLGEIFAAQRRKQLMEGQEAFFAAIGDGPYEKRCRELMTAQQDRIKDIIADRETVDLGRALEKRAASVK